MVIKNQKLKGFTLAELLVIIGVIGILAFFTMPALRNFQSTMRLNGVSRELISDIRYAQQLAITEQLEYCVQFFPLEKRYQLIQCGGAVPIKESLLPEEIISLSVNDLTDNEIRYNPYGAVQEEGNIILENTKHETKTILVKISGFVKIGD